MGRCASPSRESWLMITGFGEESNRDARADGIAEGPGSPDWAEFAAWRLTGWRERVFGLLVDQSWGLVSVPEYVGPDIEFVRIAPGGEARELVAGEPVVVQTLTLRLVDGAWFIAGVGRTLPVPGWPPREQELATDFAP